MLRPVPPSAMYAALVSAPIWVVSPVAINSASEEAIEKHHAKGKLTARERLEVLLGPRSFEELDTFVRHRTTDFRLRRT